jgi:DNA-binding GntR family transcriptional regulator
MSRNSPRRKPARPRAAKGAPLLKEVAYRELKQRIQHGAFPEGTFLSERRLVAELGMSKTPIRSALERLEVDGLVSVSPQQGVVVRGLSLREEAELFDLRAAIEPFTARRLAGRLTAEQGARLGKNLQAQAAAVRVPDPAASVGLDVEFHLLLAESLGNREVARLLEQVLAKLYREITRITLGARGRLADSYREHAGVAEAIESGDADLAARRMEDHLRFGRQYLLAE